jgi:hypothetical protein
MCCPASYPIGLEGTVVRMTVGSVNFPRSNTLLLPATIFGSRSTMSSVFARLSLLADPSPWCFVAGLRDMSYLSFPSKTLVGL